MRAALAHAYYNAMVVVGMTTTFWGVLSFPRTTPGALLGVGGVTLAFWATDA